MRKEALVAKGMAYTEAWNGNDSVVFGGRDMSGGDVSGKVSN